MSQIPTLRLKSQARACRDALTEVFQSVFIEHRPADRVLSAFLRSNHKYGSRDRQLISEATFAVFRWWGVLRKLLKPETLDAMEKHRVEVEIQSHNPAWDIPDKTFSAILLGACILDRRELPEAAAVWENDLNFDFSSLRRSGLDRYSSLEHLVPGVIAALAGAADFKNVSPASVEELLPEWVYPFLPQGIDNLELIKWFQQRPPMWLRAQCDDMEGLFRKLKNHGLSIQRHPNILKAVCVENARVNLYSLDEFRSGLFEVQDLASQVIGLVCAPKPGERWWDACAGAGGKTLQLADIMQRKGSIIATDIREYKLDDLRKRARRAGFPNIMCKEWNGKALRKKQQENFDGVLVDSPCSCSGTWRRNPDARWTTSPDEITEMAELQLSILNNASSGVKKGGTLVYATCSIFAGENIGVVEKFMEQNPDYVLEGFINPVNGEKTDGFIQVLPWDGNCDAMFAARFRRTQN
jgi:16S rRNA (cytosine967-C5)-methyltransferase